MEPIFDMQICDGGKKKYLEGYIWNESTFTSINQSKIYCIN